MEIYKNKASGDNFIYIDDSGNHEAIFVTPQNEIKSLNLSLFIELADGDVDYLRSKNLITEAQVERYKQYDRNRLEDKVKNFKYQFERLSDSQKEKFLEDIKKENRDSEKGGTKPL